MNPWRKNFSCKLTGEAVDNQMERYKIYVKESGDHQEALYKHI